VSFSASFSASFFDFSLTHHRSHRSSASRTREYFVKLAFQVLLYFKILLPFVRIGRFRIARSSPPTRPPAAGSLR
jgi:hypothetical protein